METINRLLKALKPVPDPKKVEEKRIEAIIEKQRKIEREEINLEWNFVFGLIKPKKKKQLKKIKNITLRNIWMEEFFIFHQIEAYQPDEVFHEPKCYTLQYTLPNSPFTMLISLTDRTLQEEAIRSIALLKKSDRKKLIFHFVPISNTMPMYGIKVPKASLESFRTKADVLNKLCNLYVAGRIPLADFNIALDGGYEAWKLSVFTFMPDDEKQYHTYLKEKTLKKIEKSIERKYMDDDIKLKEYEDLKFPERKKRNDAEALTYPLPYLQGPCIICKCERAIIKCLQCPNLVCRDCIINEFLCEDSSWGSFMLVHRRFCMRFGQVPDIAISVEPCPGYLNLLRATGKRNADRKLAAIQAVQEEIKDDDIVIGEQVDEDLIDVEAQRKLELEKIFLESATTLKALIDKYQVKFDKSFKKFMDYQLIIDDIKKTVQMRERTKRLRDEDVSSYEKHVKPKRSVVDSAFQAADSSLLTFDKSIPVQYEQFCETVDKIDRLIHSDTVKSFKQREAEILEQNIAKESKRISSSIHVNTS